MTKDNKDKDGKACDIKGMYGGMSADRKLQAIYGVLVLLFVILWQQGFAWAFWGLVITGASMLADSLFNMCFFARWVRKCCGESCDTDKDDSQSGKAA